MSAYDKRMVAIGEITTRFLFIHELDGTTVHYGTTVEEVVKAIKALHPMGRTARWNNAIDAWTEMVTDSPDDMVWAILQGAVGAGYAAK